MFPSVNEAGELKEGKPNRMTTAQTRVPQAAQGNGTSVPDASSEKPRQAGAPQDEPRVPETDVAEKRFEIVSYTVEGNTILEQEKIDSILKPYKG